ncbi:MAG TPA: hypothetical protein VGM39_00155 [Kofleriaceae bacterium]|jgi:hypothetical protein
MLDSGAARVLAVGIGIGAGLLVPWLRHHNDRDPSPTLYVDPPNAEAPTPTVEESPPAPVDEHLGEVRLDMAHPGLEEEQALPNARSFASGTTFLSMEERETVQQWSKEAMRLYLDDTGSHSLVLGAKQSDGRVPFRTTNVNGTWYGWFGTKTCESWQVVVVATAQTKAAAEKLAPSFRAARCTSP